eukprot:GFUD01018737.1.p1 GENE.GFUD01018737.1~~GFUD01018737.1.p1  ORF type:complete len:886 (+),score=196.54 GFUD01018737.1:76-2733(+)
MSDEGDMERDKQSGEDISTTDENIKHDPCDQQQVVVAKIRPTSPEEQNSNKYWSKMEWLQQCPFCFKWMGNLVLHVKTAHEGENFRQIRTQCPIVECGKLVVDIKTHINKVHKGVKNFQCEHCPARFPSNYGLTLHTRNMHSNNRRVKCVECEGKFKISSLKNHIQRVHRGLKKALPCPEEDCDKIFGSKGDLERHVLGCHRKWKTPCPECGKKISMESLLNHIKVVHRGLYPFQCSHCDRGFQNHMNLETHVRAQHNGTFLFCKATTTKGVECRKVMFSEDTLLKHVENKHLDEGGMRTVACPECGTAILPCYLAHHVSAEHHSSQKAGQCLVEGCTDQLSGGDDLKQHLETVHSSLSLEWCSQCSQPTLNLTSHSKLLHEVQRLFQPLYGICVTQACSWEGCTFMGRSSTHLANHVYQKHKRMTNIKCDQCGMQTTNITEHIRIQHTKEKTLECEICKKLFLKIGDLNQHMKTHSEERQKVTCPDCNAEVINLRQHVRFVHEKDLPFKCKKSSCKTRFSSKHALHKHMESVHEGKRFECPLCLKMVTSLRNHTRIVHEKIRAHECPLCQKTFQSRPHLRNHVTRVHLGLKDECPECGRLVQDLKNHRNFVHKKVANFPCDQCDRKCITSTALKIHMSSVHLGEKIECPECGEKVCKVYLQQHIRKQHQVREKFKCDECGKPFTCRSYLAKHIQRVHMEVRQKCKVCGLETKDLYRHSKYTDCGKKGYVVRTRRNKIESEAQNFQGRVTRSRSKIKFETNIIEPLEGSDSDVEIEEVMDTHEDEHLVEEPLEPGLKQETCSLPVSANNSTEESDSDVEIIEEIKDMYDGLNMKVKIENESISAEFEEDKFSFLSSRISETESAGMFSPIPITDLKIINKYSELQ